MELFWIEGIKNASHALLEHTTMCWVKPSSPSAKIAKQAPFHLKDKGIALAVARELILLKIKRQNATIVRQGDIQSINQTTNALDVTAAVTNHLKGRHFAKSALRKRTLKQVLLSVTIVRPDRCNPQPENAPVGAARSTPTYR